MGSTHSVAGVLNKRWPWVMHVENPYLGAKCVISVHFITEP